MPQRPLESRPKTLTPAKPAPRETREVVLAGTPPCPKPARTVETGYRGGTHVHTLETLSDHRGIGIWVSDDSHWARGYAERAAARCGRRLVIEEIEYVLNNPIEVDDLTNCERIWG